MCLILFDYRSHPEYQLILLANRDEFYQRPTAPLGYWSDTPAILAGRDLYGNGTWLGINRDGRLAAITNYRDPHRIKADPPSRGLLVSNYLKGSRTPQKYLEELLPNCSDYNGFNLLVGDEKELLYLSNYQSRIVDVQPGIHGLSNHLLDTAWPKVLDGKRRLERYLTKGSDVVLEDLITILSDRSIPRDNRLPDTGIGMEWERILAPIFIQSPNYGTRCSSVILIKYSGEIHFQERTYPQGTHQYIDLLRNFTLSSQERI